jgi:Holliday junction DNA helicase RuvB
MSESRPTEVNAIKPTSLKHLIGQRCVIEQVSVGLEAAFADTRKFDHSLLVGPPGLGKSALAHVIAQEVASKLHEVLGQSLKNVADMNALLLGAKDFDIIHIDECHELNKSFQTTLFLALDQKRLIIGSGKSGRAIQSLPLCDFTLLLSTTDEYGLLQPLRDRMKLVLRFEYYSSDELVTVVRHRTQSLGWSVEETILPQIAERSRGTPRFALRLLQSTHRVCRSEGEHTLSESHLRKACKLEGIDNLGLGPTEQQYLSLLKEGINRLNVIASMMGLPARTIAQVAEPFLLRTGLILKDDQGRRELTSKGREHLSSLCAGGA